MLFEQFLNDPTSLSVEEIKQIEIEDAFIQIQELYDENEPKFINFIKNVTINQLKALYSKYYLSQWDYGQIARILPKISNDEDILNKASLFFHFVNDSMETHGLNMERSDASMMCADDDFADSPYFNSLERSQIFSRLACYCTIYARNPHRSIKPEPGHVWAKRDDSSYFN